MLIKGRVAAAVLATVSVVGQGRETIRIVLPAAAANARCAVVQKDGTVAQVEGPPLLLTCPGNDETVVCDFSNAEPVDVPLAELCRTRAIPFRAADRVLLLMKTPAAISIQWLAFSPDIRGVPVLATREWAAVGRQDIPVSPREERFIRVSRPGACPLTMPAAELIKRKQFSVPDAVPGGELIARIEATAVAPESYRFDSGTQATELRPQGQLLLARGVRAGRYRLTPLYPGGVSGRPRPVPVEDGRSTAFYIRRENVGAVDVDTEPAVCRDAVTLRIVRVDSSRSARGVVTARERVATVATHGACAQRIGGLVGGTYEASYEGTRGVLATQSFSVDADVLRSVMVSAPTVRVYGRVSINGEPADDVSVAYIRTPEETGSRGTQTICDAQGFYEMALSKPGTFQVAFRKDGNVLLGVERMARLAAGDNQIDWELQVGQLKVNVHGWDRSSPLTLTVIRRRMPTPGQTGTAVRVQPTDRMPVTIGGLAFDDYVIEARQHDAVSAAPDRVGTATARIEKEKGESSVDVNIKSSDRPLSLVDPQGNPVSGAVVSGGVVETASEISPGTYSLADIAPGTRLRIKAPGFTPVCRIATDSSMQVELQGGVPVRLQFSGRTDGVEQPPGQLLWSGTECPVPFVQFEYAKTPSADPTVVEFMVRPIPRAGEYIFLLDPSETPDRWQRVRIDADGTMRVRLPSAR